MFPAFRIAETNFLLTAITLTGCASKISDDPGTHEDAGARSHDDAAAEPPLEEDPIRLTLWPFWGIPADGDRFGLAVPLEGVRLCVAQKRRYGEPWERFVETHGPCSAPTVANEPVVVEGVPPNAELILTAEKEAYVPRAFAVISGAVDQDATAGFFGGDANQMHLLEPDAFRMAFPSADIELGQLVILSSGMSWADSDGVVPMPFFPLEGVSVSLDPASGDGPFYGRGGAVDPLATAIPSGSLSPPSEVPYASFMNLNPGEYLVNAVHANAVCAVMMSHGNTIQGYPDDTYAIRAPVLAGFYTEVMATCTCRLPSEPGTCTPLGAEAGAP